MASANPRQHQPPDPGIPTNPVLEQEVHRAQQAVTECQQRISAVNNDIEVVRTQGNARFVSHEKTPDLVKMKTDEYRNRPRQFEDISEEIYRTLKAEIEAPIQIRPVSDVSVEYTSMQHLREMFFSTPKIPVLLQRTRDYSLVNKYGHRHPGDTSTMQCLLSPQTSSHDSETEVEAAVNSLLVNSQLKKFLAIGICSLEPQAYYENNISHVDNDGIVYTYDGQPKLPALTYQLADQDFKNACSQIWASGSQIPVLQKDDRNRVIEATIMSDPAKYNDWFKGNNPFAIAQVITFSNVEGEHLIFDLAQSSAPRRSILRVLADSSVTKVIADAQDIDLALPTALLTPRARFNNQSLFTMETYFDQLTVPGTNAAFSYLQLVRRLRQLPAMNIGNTLFRAADTYFHSTGYTDINDRSILRHHSYYGVPNENDINVLEHGGPGYEISKMRALMAMDISLAIMSSDARTLSKHALTRIAITAREVASFLPTPTTIIPYAKQGLALPPSNWLCRFNQPCIDPFLEKFNSEGGNSYRTRIDALHNDKTRFVQELAELETTLRRANNRLADWQTHARKRRSPDEDMESNGTPSSRPRTGSTSTSSRPDHRRSKSQSSRRHDPPRTRVSPPPDPNRYRRIHTDLPLPVPVQLQQQQAPAPIQPVIPAVAPKSRASFLTMPRVNPEAAAKQELERKLAPSGEADDSSRQTRSQPPLAQLPVSKPVIASTTPAIKQPKIKFKPTDPAPTDPNQLAQWIAACRATWPAVFTERGQLNDHDIHVLLGIDWTQYTKNMTNIFIPFTRTTLKRPYAPCPQIEITAAQYEDNLLLHSPEAICLKNWKIVYRDAYKWLCKSRPFACSPILYSALASEAILFAEYSCLQWLLRYPEKRAATASLFLEFYLFVARSCVVPTLLEHCSLRGETETGQVPRPGYVQADVLFSANTSQLRITRYPGWEVPLTYIPEPTNDEFLQEFGNLQAAIPTSPVITFTDRVTIPYLLGRILNNVYIKTPFSGACQSQPLIGSLYQPITVVRSTFEQVKTMGRTMSALPEELSMATAAVITLRTIPETSIRSLTVSDTDTDTRLSASGSTVTPSSTNDSVSPIAQTPRTSKVQRFAEAIDSVIQQQRIGHVTVQPMEIDHGTAPSALVQHLNDAMALHEQASSTVTRSIITNDTSASIDQVTGEILQPIPPTVHLQNQVKEGDGIVIVSVDEEMDSKEIPRLSDNNEENNDNINEEVMSGHSSSDSSESSQQSPARFKSHSSSSQQQVVLVSEEEEEQDGQQQPQQQQHVPTSTGKTRRSQR